ncbi:hypothetical protein K469DRAFT_706295 [Zopfia rhizophila CBS 207.26]|uniref:Xaa-Pro aminopeptidase n=1 Tax=Zopfia rhizophila CBS 207.26 TaxID=1314779 RepID=A0A6A6EUZ5_9PEZI|nr:hypothetical protein K469DRAFT_706295 [Zopfia rhizophila CBS 207.26]
MEQFDARSLHERLQWEQQDYWLHLEAGSPFEKYPAKQHAQRVKEKLGVPDGLIYLPGSRNRNNEDSDMPAPFRQRRYFYYMSGCNEPDCHLTYDIQNDSLVLFIPKINPGKVIWYGRGSTTAEALAKYDIDHVFYTDELTDWIEDWSRYYKGRVYILHEPQNPPRPWCTGVDSKSLQPAMDLARLIKDEHEIKLIRKANDISSKAHREVLANILTFKNEAQVEGLFLDVCISEHAKNQAYAPIAASGPNAGTLHYDANDDDFEDRQLMCLDAGCEWELYASDITRTFPLSGSWPSNEAKNIYSLVQRMQETCIERLAPGVRYLDLHILAHQIAIDGLLSLGILHNGTREEIYKAGTSRAFFPHGLGHHVGLEVHDVGQRDLMSLAKQNPIYSMAPSLYPENFHLPVYDAETCRSPTNPQSGHLEEGMVVTVEPGIYFSTYALNKFYLPDPVHSKYINTEVVARYLPVGGVRIEDDILITSKGYENLTTAPKGEAMLEIIRSQNAHWPFIREPSNLRRSTLRDTKVERKSTAPVEQEKPLLRAPGICRHATEPIAKPLSRISSFESSKSDRLSKPDFEAFNGPSLFSKFNPSVEALRTAEDVANWCNTGSRRTERSDPALKMHNAVCGEDDPTVTHAYMNFPSQPGLAGGATAKNERIPPKPNCKKCAILVQTVNRLRTNLREREREEEKSRSIKVEASKSRPTERGLSKPRSLPQYSPSILHPFAKFDGSALRKAAPEDDKPIPLGSGRLPNPSKHDQKDPQARYASQNNLFDPKKDDNSISQQFTDINRPTPQNAALETEKPRPQPSRGQLSYRQSLPNLSRNPYHSAATSRPLSNRLNPTSTLDNLKETPPKTSSSRDPRSMNRYGTVDRVKDVQRNPWIPTSAPPPPPSKSNEFYSRRCSVTTVEPYSPLVYNIHVPDYRAVGATRPDNAHQNQSPAGAMGIRRSVTFSQPSAPTNDALPIRATVPSQRSGCKQSLRSNSALQRKESERVKALEKEVVENRGREPEDKWMRRPDRDSNKALDDLKDAIQRLWEVKEELGRLEGMKGL